MLSILIPAFGSVVDGLIDSLHNQCTLLKIKFEIIVSNDNPNLQLAILSEKRENTLYFDQLRTLGRAANRAFLANTAHYDYLLFIDSDFEVGNDLVSDFLKHKDEQKVIVGSIKYKNGYKTETLRYNYGKQVEEKQTKGFSAAIFLCSKKGFLKAKSKLIFPFNSYGHEDTLLGYAFNELDYSIVRIDTKSYHLGIDEDIVFFDKTEEALQNLKKLTKNKNLRVILLKYNSFVKLNNNVLIIFIFYLLKPFTPSFKKIVRRHNSKIWLFQFYKLLYYQSISLEKI